MDGLQIRKLFITAAMDGDKKKVKKFLQQGISISIVCSIISCNKLCNFLPFDG